MASNPVLVRMITNLVQSKIGPDHPKAQEVIDKYTAVTASVEFNHTPDDIAKFQQILSDVQEEIKELGPLNPR